MTVKPFYAVFVARTNRTVCADDGFDLAGWRATLSGVRKLYSEELGLMPDQQACVTVWRFDVARGWNHIVTRSNCDDLMDATRLVDAPEAYLRSAMAEAIATAANEADWFSDEDREGKRACVDGCGSTEG